MADTNHLYSSFSVQKYLESQYIQGQNIAKFNLSDVIANAEIP